MLGQFVVRVADLVEAEAHLARRGLFQLIIASVAVISAAVLLLVGTLTVVAAVYVALRRVLPTDGACAVIGVILIAMGLACAMVAGRMGRSR